MVGAAAPAFLTEPFSLQFASNINDGKTNMADNKLFFIFINGFVDKIIFFKITPFLRALRLKLSTVGLILSKNIPQFNYVCQ